MEIKLDWDWLKTQKLFIATPMFAGQCFGTFRRSLCETVTTFTQREIPLQLYSLFNESLITRARAYACDEFLELMRLIFSLLILILAFLLMILFA